MKIKCFNKKRAEFLRARFLHDMIDKTVNKRLYQYVYKSFRSSFIKMSRSFPPSAPNDLYSDSCLSSKSMVAIAYPHVPSPRAIILPVVGCAIQHFEGVGLEVIT